MLLEGGLLSWDCHIGPYISAFSLVPGPVVVSEFTEGRRDGGGEGGLATSPPGSLRMRSSKGH